MLTRRVLARAGSGVGTRASSNIFPTGVSSSPVRIPREHPHLNYALGYGGIHLRAMDMIHSPADALAIIRAIERRFGRIAEYHFYRDPDDSKYQFIAHFGFRDFEAYARVPKGSIVIRVTVPPLPQVRPSGGVGLADLAPLLNAQDWTDNDLTKEVSDHFNAPPSDDVRVIPVRLEHYSGGWRSQKFDPPAYAARFNRPLANKFVQWGGFAPIKPLPAPVHITRSNLIFGEPVDHPRMRHLMKIWSASLNVRNPYEYSPELSSPPPRRTNPRSPATAATAPPRTTPSASDVADALATPAADTAVPPTPLKNAASPPPPAPEAGPQPLATDITAQMEGEPEVVVEQASPTADAKATPQKVWQIPPKAPPNVAATWQMPSRAEPTQTPVKTTKPGLPMARVTQTPSRAEFAPVAPKTQVRAARGALRKMDPAPKPAVETKKPKQKEERPAPLPAQPSKKKAKEVKQASQPSGVKAAPPPPQRPIEVEERQAGITERLKGLFGGWR
ncbi:hypothetical protein C8R44DRAFT_734419 [Mycena epipterygia]|nr:hypothetical protein C8R44DRAFT_734419 [Mycena epipterygia]